MSVNRTGHRAATTRTFPELLLKLFDRGEQRVEVLFGLDPALVSRVAARHHALEAVEHARAPPLVLPAGRARNGRGLCGSASAHVSSFPRSIDAGRQGVHQEEREAIMDKGRSRVSPRTAATQQSRDSPLGASTDIVAARSQQVREGLTDLASDTSC